MKSPKLFGQPGATMAMGKAKARALQGTGAPFLTARGPGYTARTKNGFLKVEVDEAGAEEKPANFWTCDGEYQQASFKLRRKGKLLTGEPYPSPVGVMFASTGALWVAPDRLLALRKDELYIPLLESFFWPALLKPSTAAEVLVGDEQESRKGVSFQPIGLANLAIQSLFVTGSDEQQYRWGYSSKPYRPSFVSPYVLPYNVPENRITVHLGGVDRESGAVVAPYTTDLPPEVGRTHFGGRVYCAGPGKLISLVSVAEQHTTDTDRTGPTPLKPSVYPYLCVSNDHGATWERISAPLLEGVVDEVRAYPGVGVGTPFDYRCLNNSQLEAAATYFKSTYIGAGVSLMFVASKHNSAANSVKCFRYEAGSLTPVSWGGEAPMQYETLTAFAPRSHWVSHCFGVGCTVEVLSSISGESYLISTRDFGASWQSSPTVPFIHDPQPVVLEPYANSERPGKILFIGTASAAGASTGATPGATSMWVTDGAFTTFKYLGRPTPTGMSANYAVPFLDRTKTSLALPDEFGPPT